MSLNVIERTREIGVMRDRRDQRRARLAGDRDHGRGAREPVAGQERHVGQRERNLRV
jgi:hypothetical protein